MDPSEVTPWRVGLSIFLFVLCSNAIWVLPCFFPWLSLISIFFVSITFILIICYLPSYLQIEKPETTAAGATAFTLVCSLLTFWWFSCSYCPSAFVWKTRIDYPIHDFRKNPEPGYYEFAKGGIVQWEKAKEWKTGSKNPKFWTDTGVDPRTTWLAAPIVTVLDKTNDSNWVVRQEAWALLRNSHDMSTWKDQNFTYAICCPDVDEEWRVDYLFPKNGGPYAFLSWREWEDEKFSIIAMVVNYVLGVPLLLIIIILLAVLLIPSPTAPLFQSANPRYGTFHQ